MDEKYRADNFMDAPLSSESRKITAVPSTNKNVSKLIFPTSSTNAEDPVSASKPKFIHGQAAASTDELLESLHIASKSFANVKSTPKPPTNRSNQVSKNISATEPQSNLSSEKVPSTFSPLRSLSNFLSKSFLKSSSSLSKKTASEQDREILKNKKKKRKSSAKKEDLKRGALTSPANEARKTSKIKNKSTKKKVAESDNQQSFYDNFYYDLFEN